MTESEYAYCEKRPRSESAESEKAESQSAENTEENKHVNI